MFLQVRSGQHSATGILQITKMYAFIVKRKRTGEKNDPQSRFLAKIFTPETNEME